MRTQNTLKQLRAYQQNGLPRELKRELRGQQKELETYLDKAKAEARANYTEQRWN
tara:strand:+ start:708 stop:872 length:165 start_codon:yes stop_codon:yes gene_type:complete